MKIPDWFDVNYAYSKGGTIKKEEKVDYLKDPETVQAIKDSVRHWEEDVIVKIKKGKTLSQTYDYGANYCPLCKIFDVCEDGCPLFLKGVGCNKNGSPWDIFDKSRTLENAQNMVLALKSLFYPEEPKKEVFYSRGQRFICGYNKREVQLNFCGYNDEGKPLMTFNFKDGSCWHRSYKVNDSTKITEQEFEEICDGENFKLKESGK